MDSLNYYYYSGTNQLKRITDNVAASAFVHPDNHIIDIDNQPDNNYGYDAIGNLIKDSAENITGIKWNVYGKIEEINRTATATVPASNIKYTYDAMGNRISQVVTSGGTKTYTWYVRDAQGNIMTTYSAAGPYSALDSLKLKLADRFLYGSSRLGTITVVDDNIDGTGPASTQYYYENRKFAYDRGFKQYELTNHLGNVLATISDRKFGVSSGGSSLISYYEPHIVTAQDYYPFGMLSRVALPNNNKDYKFGFNGKLNDNEVKGGLGNQQDYGMRIYDPRIGKFLSVDPLTKGYPMLTPYQYASNTPIAAIDIDGEEAGVLNLTNGYGFTNSGIPLSNYFDNAKGRKTVAKALGIGVAVGGAVATDVFVFKGAATRYTLYTLGVIGTGNFISTVNNNGMQHDPKIRAENERKAKQQATELIIGFGVGYSLGKGLQAGKLFAQEAGLFKAPLLDPMTAEMLTPLTEPLPLTGRQAGRIMKEFKEQYGIKPEKIYLENGKHGIDWTEGPNTAKIENLPQGQWTLEDLKFAAEKAATLKVGQHDFFALPAESKSVVHLPDGRTVKATRIFVRNDGETFHGHPRND